MKNPSVPSRCGRVCTKPGTRPWSHSGTSARRSSALEVPALGQERLRRRPRSRRARSCRSSTRACRRGAARRRRRAGSRPARARAARAGRRPCASARRGARRACRGPCTAGRRARGRSAPGSCGPAASAVRTSITPPRPCASAVRRSASARPAMALDGDDPARCPASARPGAWSCRRARRTGRARARRAAGRAAAPTVIAARDCGMKRPSSHSGESNASNGPSSTRPFGQPGRGVARHGEAGGQLGGVRAQRVDAQRGLGRLVVGGHQRAGARPVRAPRTTARRSTPGASGAARPRRASRRAARRRARPPRAPRGAGRR